MIVLTTFPDLFYYSDAKDCYWQDTATNGRRGNAQAQGKAMIFPFALYQDINEQRQQVCGGRWAKHMYSGSFIRTGSIITCWNLRTGCPLCLALYQQFRPVKWREQILESFDSPVSPDPSSPCSYYLEILL